MLLTGCIIGMEHAFITTTGLIVFGYIISEVQNTHHAAMNFERVQKPKECVTSG